MSILETSGGTFSIFSWRWWRERKTWRRRKKERKVGDEFFLLNLLLALSRKRFIRCYCRVKTRRGVQYKVRGKRLFDMYDAWKIKSGKGKDGGSF